MGSNSTPSHGNSYLLPRDSAESSRLSAQHYTMVRRQGWLLHPKVEEAMSVLDSPQIADVACGTAIWAVEVAERWPNASLTGLDISTSQFPPEWTLPANVTLNMLDILGEIGPEYHGKFDVVHVRLVLTAGPLTDPRNWVKAFSSLLKPGGYLQWEDLPYPTMHKVMPLIRNGRATGDWETSIFRYDKVAEVSHLNHKAGWYADFQNWMRQNSSLQDIEQLNIPIHLPTLKTENDVASAAFFSAVRTFLSIMKIDDETLLEGIQQDVADYEKVGAEGALVAFRWIVGLARAP